MRTEVRVVEYTMKDHKKWDLEESVKRPLPFLRWAFPLFYRIKWCPVHKVITGRMYDPEKGLSTNIKSVEEALELRGQIETMLNPTYHYQ
jgi:hypothetical protein